MAGVPFLAAVLLCAAAVTAVEFNDPCTASDGTPLPRLEFALADHPTDVKLCCVQSDMSCMWGDIVVGFAARDDDGVLSLQSDVHALPLPPQLQPAGGSRRVLRGDSAARQLSTLRVFGDYKHWPEGVVPFVIDAGLAAVAGSNALIDSVYQAMITIAADTAVRFTQYTEDDVTAGAVQDYVRIQYLENRCNSLVGRGGGEQALNLDPTSCAYGTIIHEIMHALGFYHEQSRHDRDTYVTVHEANIISGFESNFDVVSCSSYENCLDVTTPYDYASIMHYRRDAFCVENCPPEGTLEATAALAEESPELQDVVATYGYGSLGVMSTYDRADMQHMYGRCNPQPVTCARLRVDGRDGPSDYDGTYLFDQGLVDQGFSIQGAWRRDTGDSIIIAFSSWRILAQGGASFPEASGGFGGTFPPADAVWGVSTTTVALDIQCWRDAGDPPQYDWVTGLWGPCLGDPSGVVARRREVHCKETATGACGTAADCPTDPPSSSAECSAVAVPAPGSCEFSVVRDGQEWMDSMCGYVNEESDLEDFQLRTGPIALRPVLDAFAEWGPSGAQDATTTDGSTPGYLVAFDFGRLPDAASAAIRGPVFNPSPAADAGAGTEPCALSFAMHAYTAGYSRRPWTMDVEFVAVDSAGAVTDVTPVYTVDSQDPKFPSPDWQLFDVTVGVDVTPTDGYLRFNLVANPAASGNIEPVGLDSIRLTNCRAAGEGGGGEPVESQPVPFPYGRQDVRYYSVMDSFITPVCVPAPRAPADCSDRFAVQLNGVDYFHMPAQHLIKVAPPSLPVA